MSIKRTLLTIVVITLASLAFSLWAYPQLPEMTPSHWNAAGEVDGTMRRETLILLMPALILVIGLLLLYIPSIDPLRANVERFRDPYNWFIIGMSFYFLFLHVLVILAGLGFGFNMTYLLIPAVSLVLVGIGFMLEKTKPNWFLGIRTPWTLTSPTVWEKTHHLGGILFKLSGAILLAGLVVPPDTAFLLMIGLILTITLVTVVYSYIAFRAEHSGKVNNQ